MSIRRPILQPDSEKNTPKHVSFLQQLLYTQKYLKELSQINGNFDDPTLQAVKEFQLANDLTVDGIVGPLTWDKLTKSNLITSPSNAEEKDLNENLEPGLALIRYFEGCKLSAYPDPLTGGKPLTIGYGSTRKKDGSTWKLGERLLNKTEAEELLEHQIRTTYLPQLRRIPYWEEMNDNQRGALISFAWNVGAYFYGSSKFETITEALKEKQWAMVPKALMLYRNPGTKVERGLRIRRQEEGQLWSRNVEA